MSDHAMVRWLRVTLLTIVCLAGLLGAGIVIAGGVLGIRDGIASTSTAQGTITAVGKDCHGLYVDAHGIEHPFTHFGDKANCANQFTVGERVRVYYDPARPSVADTNSPTYTIVVHAILLPVGGALAIVVLWRFSPIRPRSRRPKHAVVG